MKAKDHVMRERARHHEALKSMLPEGDMRTGLQVWRQLRRLETRAGQLALQLCNGPKIPESVRESIEVKIRSGVSRVFGYTPPGFFINFDPRGWALKLEPGSVPHKLHQDWGGYQILAPVIE